jgi:hypothetical protein
MKFNIDSMKNLFFFICCTLFFSCSTENIENDFDQIEVRSGESFGFCVGKCYSEVIFEGNQQKLLVKESIFNDNVFTEKEKVYTEQVLLSTKNEIFKLIDFEEFMALDEVYGCPDCADGGAEWIEIKKGNGEIKKVKFEYGDTVPGHKNLVILLRKERKRLFEKYAK